MKITARREIFIERERTLTIRFNAAPAIEFCAECQTQTSFVNINQAAIIAQKTDREIFRLVEAGRLHCRESAEGFLLVCLASLQNLRAAITTNQITTGEK